MLTRDLVSVSYNLAFREWRIIERKKETSVTRHGSLHVGIFIINTFLIFPKISLGTRSVTGMGKDQLRGQSIQVRLDSGRIGFLSSFMNFPTGSLGLVL